MLAGWLRTVNSKVLSREGCWQAAPELVHKTRTLEVFLFQSAAQTTLRALGSATCLATSEQTVSGVRRLASSVKHGLRVALTRVVTAVATRSSTSACV